MELAISDHFRKPASVSKGGVSHEKKKKKNASRRAHKNISAGYNNNDKKNIDSTYRVLQDLHNIPTSSLSTMLSNPISDSVRVILAKEKKDGEK